MQTSKNQENSELNEVDDIVNIELGVCDVSNMLYFCDELSNHCTSAHDYLKTLHVAFKYLEKVVNPNVNEVFQDLKDDLTELFSLLQNGRSVIESVSDTLRTHVAE